MTVEVPQIRSSTVGGDLRLVKGFLGVYTPFFALRLTVRECSFFSPRALTARGLGGGGALTPGVVLPGVRPPVVAFRCANSYSEFVDGDFRLNAVSKTTTPITPTTTTTPTTSLCSVMDSPWKQRKYHVEKRTALEWDKLRQVA